MSNVVYRRVELLVLEGALRISNCAKQLLVQQNDDFKIKTTARVVPAAPKNRNKFNK